MKRSAASLLLLALSALLCETAPAQSGYCHLDPWNYGGAPMASTLGAAVAIDTTGAAVGDPQQGKVLMRLRLGSLWYPFGTLENPDGPGTSFGAAVAISGNRLWVGAPGWNGVGAVHRFQSGPGGWVHLGRLESPTSTHEGSFGAALSFHNGWLAVGAPGEAGTGRVHVYDFSTGAAQLVRTVNGPTANAEFGRSVALHRPPGSASAYLFAGAPMDDSDSNNAGAVRMYRVHPLELAFGPALVPTQLDPGDVFGISVAFDGEHLVVGASGDDDVAPSAGAAYVYDVGLAPMAATLAVKLTGPATDAGDFFGRTVAVSGNRIAVGALLQAAPNGGTGRLHLFRPAVFGASWVHDRYLLAHAGETAYCLSSAVALDGHQVLVGASQSAIAEGVRAGAILFSTASSSQAGGLCPSPHLSTAIAYGPSKGGPAGAPTMSFLSPPVPGQNALLVVKGLKPGTVPTLLVGTAPDALPFDGGHFLVANPLLLSLPAVSILGQLGVGWNVPNQPALIGLPLYAQVFSFDVEAVGQFATVHTRGLGFSVGY